MIFPLYDEQRPRRVSLFSYVTTWIIILNVLIFAFQSTLSPQEKNLWFDAFGFTDQPLIWSSHFWGILQDSLSYQFLHANFWHLFGNMVFLFVFGDNVENAFGRLRFLLFYLLCGVASALFFAYFMGGNTSLIGASGSISGVAAAYLLMFPRARLWFLLSFIPLRLPAVFPLIAWILFQLLGYINNTQSDVAYLAHIGGLLTGFALTPLFKHPHIPWFGNAKPLRIRGTPTLPIISASKEESAFRENGD